MRRTILLALALFLLATGLAALAQSGDAAGRVVVAEVEGSSTP